MVKITKTVPNPAYPSEVLRHYVEHLFRWFIIWYRDGSRDLLGTKRKKRFQKLKKYEKSGKGKVAFILAGGPSINSLDPIKLRNFCDQNNGEIFSVNYFVNSEFAETVKIDNWVISDFNHFDVNRPDTQKAHAQVNAGICKRIFAAEQYAHHLNGKTPVEVIPFNDLETSRIYSSNINPCYPRSYISMTAYKALALAVYMGYDKIYICGFDNTYIRDLDCDSNNKLYRRLIHFYSVNQTLSQDTINANRVKLSDRTVTDELLSYSRLFSDLTRFKKFPIINLDINSLTDAFPKSSDLDIYKN